MASLMSILKQAGFRGEGLRMAYAIAMAESSGNAYSHNTNARTGDNSYGLFQINMIGGMGPERRKRYGLKSNDDLFDPLTNARVAYAMSNGGKNWHPWTTYTKGYYKTYYGSSGAQVTYKDSGGAAGGLVVPNIDKKTLAAMFGLSWDLINSNKELKDLFNKAVAGDWGLSTQGQLRFQAALKNTKWWKTQSSSLRKYITMKYTDPASWKASREAAAAAMKVLAVDVGMQYSDLVKSGKWTDLLNDLVYKKVALGWTDARLKSYVGAKTSLHGGMMYGAAGEAFDKLHTLTYTNGISHNSSWFESRARDIVSGKSTLEAEEAKIRSAAASQFAGFADQIKAGQNAIDLASPYIKSVAELLELPETDVDLTNKHVSKAMTSGKTGAPYSLWQFENDVRSDPLWRKTNNARDGMFTIARSVLRDFGFSY